MVYIYTIYISTREFRYTITYRSHDSAHYVVWMLSIEHIWHNKIIEK